MREREESDGGGRDDQGGGEKEFVASRKSGRRLRIQRLTAAAKILHKERGEKIFAF